MDKLGKTTSAIVLTLTGIIMVVLGLIMLVLPGPGLLFIFLGIAVLARVYTWPRAILDWLKHKSGGLLK